jgi:hypothetical protein
MDQSLTQILWQKLIELSPPVFWSGVIIIVGLIFSKWMEILTVGLIERLRINQLLKMLGAEEILLRIDSRLNAPKFFGAIVKWFFIIVFLMAASDVLGMHQFSQFLSNVIGYFPNIFVSVLIFLVALYLTDFSQKLVLGTLERERITYSRFLSRSIVCGIWLFAILSILYQLKITPSLILVAFIGMVLTIALAVGIAFGLGGKDLAAKILKELEEKLK